MSRPRLASRFTSLFTSLVAVPALAVAALAGTASADTCDLATIPLPAVTELPAGCPLAVYAPTQPLPGLPTSWSVPTVRVRTGGAPRLASVAVAESGAVMPVHHEWCDPVSCRTQVIDDDVAATRFDIVFLEVLPAGAILEVTADAWGGGGGRLVTVSAPGACPPVQVPVGSCSLACDPGCLRPSTVDGGAVDAGVPCDGAPHDDYPDYPDDTIDVRDCGCNAGAGTASPLIPLALAALIRRGLRKWRRAPPGSLAVARSTREVHEV